MMEAESLLPRREPVEGGMPRRRAFTVGTSVIAIVALLVVLCQTLVPTPAYSAEPAQSDLEQTSPIAGHLDAIKLRVYNEYITDIPVATNYPWISEFLLAEPMRESTFIVYNDSSSDHDYVFRLTGGDDTNVTYAGSSTTHIFLNIGDYKMELSVHDSSSGAALISMTEVIRVRYVRREIRSLYAEDRIAFFDAAQVVFNTSCDEGKELYGNYFECIDTFTRLHNTLAGDPSCDHMHDGYGFLTSHAAMSLWFERVMQTVDARVSLPYWDYTIEGQIVQKSGDATSWRQSEVWGDDWFGPSDTTHTGYIVATGRWAYTPIKSGKSASNYSGFTNAYDLMRAPWNQNMIPYVTRSNTTYGFSLTDLPGCQSHYDQLKYTNFEDFGKWVQYSPHGTTHLAIGGVFNADWRNVLKGHDYDLKEAPEWVLIGFAKQKNMFRQGWLDCPVTCAPDTPMTECRCICKDIDKYLNSSDELLGVMDTVFAGEDIYFWNKNNVNEVKIILRLLCNDFHDMNPVMGDSLEAASPQDISFWPTHPTVDRLLHHRRLRGMNATHWPADVAWSVDGFAIAYCWLHNRDDVTPWPKLFSSADQPYTNGDIWDNMAPEKPYLSYVYDDFEWPHCMEDGYPLDLIQTGDDDDFEDESSSTAANSESHDDMQTASPAGGPSPPEDASAVEQPPGSSRR